MARTTKHYERVADIRKDAALLNPAKFPNRITEALEKADRLEAEYRSLGIWKKTCGMGCECKKPKGN